MPISANFIIKWFARKEKSFASGQKPFVSGLKVKINLCKWFANDLHRDGKTYERASNACVKFS